MMVMITIHRRLLTVVVLILILLNNFVISQRIVSGSLSEQQRQQQQKDQQQKEQQQLPQLVQAATTTAALTVDTIITKNGTTQSLKRQQQQQQQNGQTEKYLISRNSTISTAENATTNKIVAAATSSSQATSSSSSLSSSSTSLTSSQTVKKINSVSHKTGESSYERNSDEILSEAEDIEFEQSSILPTTFRPTRPSIASLSSPQDRERKLMNVLAARRTALHRGSFRSRVGTTGRTATSIETTSKSPTDPRSICIRNCTKNFTRRTTAGCMRQCANFSRTPTLANSNSTANSVNVIVRQTSKTGLGTQGRERDTNEILFTDESSHGLFVVAKEQNDTLNHITETGKIGSGTKIRNRGKPAIAVTLASTSIEDDDMQPYLYFGQKLPPLRPSLLAITSVSDEHPKLLEVSVAQTTTTPAAKISTSTLSAVERSRSRYKYNMRANWRRPNTGSIRPTVPTGEIGVTEQRSTTNKPKTTKTTLSTIVKRNEEINENTAPKLQITTELPTSPTPLIITVLGDEEELTQPNEDFSIMSRFKDNTEVTRKISTTPRTAKTTASSAKTTTSELTSTTASTTTLKPTTTSTSTSTSTSTTTTTTVPTTTTTPTTTTVSTTKSKATTIPTKQEITTPKRKSIIEEDTERLRAMGPSLTQPINMDEKTNLIIFINRTSGIYVPITSTTIRPIVMLNSPTTDSSSTILRTTVLTSVRSTVNPRTTTTTTTTSAPATFVGIVETATVEASIPQHSTASGSDISSTVVTDDQEISLEMHRMNVATMVLAGIGVFPLIAVVVYLVRTYVLRRHAKNDEVFDVCITDQQPISPVKKIDSKHYKDEDDDDVDNHIHNLQQNLQNNLKIRDANHNHRFDEHCSVTSDQEFDRSNIRLKSLLGEGNFGQVWKAEADDLSGHFGATRIVAVKTIRACSAQVSLKDEANIMRKLGSHQNVVTLLGACVESEPHMLIMEYAMRGRLLSLLRAARNATNILPASVPGGRSLAPLSPRTLAGFALDIACGMEYIADKRIVHRDLAARNVLLDHNGVCKICDFGMSIDLDAERKKKEQEKNCANDIMRSNLNKFKFDFGGRFIMQHWSNNFSANHCIQNKETNEKKNHHNHGHGHGHGQDTISRRPALPIRWMAPEALQFHVFTTETDVWAFGIVLWEIATLGSTPYSLLTGREVIRRIPHGLRPDLPKESRHEFYNLMSRCWHKDPHMRPSFTQARIEISRSMHKWVEDDSAASDYMDVSGFSEDLEHGMVYFNHRISEFECEI